MAVFLLDRNVDLVVGERSLQVLVHLVPDMTDRKWMQLEEHKYVALRIVESVEAGHLLQRVVGVEVG